jgi:antitoxin VapB
MGQEYRAKVFKSGNSVALRLPKALGLTEGTEVVLREEQGRYEFEPAAAVKPERINLDGIYGSVPGIVREPFEQKERDWGLLDRDG